MHKRARPLNLTSGGNAVSTGSIFVRLFTRIPSAPQQQSLGHYDAGSALAVPLIRLWSLIRDGNLCVLRPQEKFVNVPAIKTVAIILNFSIWSRFICRRVNPTLIQRNYCVVLFHDTTPKLCQSFNIDPQLGCQVRLNEPTQLDFSRGRSYR